MVSSIRIWQLDRASAQVHRKTGSQGSCWILLSDLSQALLDITTNPLGSKASSLHLRLVFGNLLAGQGRSLSYESSGPLPGTEFEEEKDFATSWLTF